MAITPPGWRKMVLLSFDLCARNCRPHRLAGIIGTSSGKRSIDVSIVGVKARDPCSMVLIETMVLYLLVCDRQQEKCEESGTWPKLDGTGCIVVERHIMDNSDEH